MPFSSLYTLGASVFKRLLTLAHDVYGDQVLLVVLRTCLCVILL